VTTDSGEVFSAFFYVPAEKSDNVFEFQFVATLVGEDNPWELLFLRVQSKPGGGSAIAVFNDLTAKETLAVFSGVKAALMKWYNSQKPDHFAFSAKSNEKTRIKLYDKFAKIIAAKLKFKMISGTLKSNKRYVFTR
jgi:hypothetical protein